MELMRTCDHYNAAGGLRRTLLGLKWNMWERGRLVRHADFGFLRAAAHRLSAGSVHGAVSAASPSSAHSALGKKLPAHPPACKTGQYVRSQPGGNAEGSGWRRALRSRLGDFHICGVCLAPLGHAPLDRDPARWKAQGPRFRRRPRNELLSEPGVPATSFGVALEHRRAGAIRDLGQGGVFGCAFGLLREPRGMLGEGKPADCSRVECSPIPGKTTRILADDESPPSAVHPSGPNGIPRVGRRATSSWCSTCRQAFLPRAIRCGSSPLRGLWVTCCPSIASWRRLRVSIAATHAGRRSRSLLSKHDRRDKIYFELAVPPGPKLEDHASLRWARLIIITLPRCNDGKSSLPDSDAIGESCNARGRELTHWVRALAASAPCGLSHSARGNVGLSLREV